MKFIVLIIIIFLLFIGCVTGNFEQWENEPGLYERDVETMVINTGTALMFGLLGGVLILNNLTY